MQTIALSEILNIADYEKVRPEYRKKVISEKANRRIAVGPLLTFVFENKNTVLFQIQEMARTERLVHDTEIQHEIDTYSRLLPTHNELSATLLIGITDKDQIKPVLDSLVALTQNSVFLRIGEHETEAYFDEEQSEEGRISAVQYIRWRLSDGDLQALRSGEAAMSIVVRHPNYQYTQQFTLEQRASIAKDVLH